MVICFFPKMCFQVTGGLFGFIFSWILLCSLSIFFLSNWWQQQWDIELSSRSQYQSRGRAWVFRGLEELFWYPHQKAHGLSYGSTSLASTGGYGHSCAAIPRILCNVLAFTYSYFPQTEITLWMLCCLRLGRNGMRDLAYLWCPARLHWEPMAYQV